MDSTSFLSTATSCSSRYVRSIRLLCFSTCRLSSSILTSITALDRELETRTPSKVISPETSATAIASVKPHPLPDASLRRKESHAVTDSPGAQGCETMRDERIEAKK